MTAARELTTRVSYSFISALEGPLVPIADGFLGLADALLRLSVSLSLRTVFLRGTSPLAGAGFTKKTGRLGKAAAQSKQPPGRSEVDYVRFFFFTFFAFFAFLAFLAMLPS
jgi:hypothetical protein